MNKLLSSNFSRLRKERIFWFCILLMCSVGIFTVGSKYANILRYQEKEQLDDALLMYSTFIGCCTALFCSLFTGTEYNDGTIRNKLVIGHRRAPIYMAGWLTSLAASLLMTLVYLLPYSVLGSFLLDAPQAPIQVILLHIFMSIFTIMAFTSLFHMISILVTKKSTSAVLCLLLFFLLLIIAVVIQSRLEAPEFFADYTMTIDGIVQNPEMPNPHYLQPTARKLHQFFYDLLPSGQSMQLAAFSVSNPIRVVLSSLVISLLSTIAGIFMFQKKNIK